MISESDAMRMTRRNFLVSTAAAMAWPMGPAAAGTVGIGGPAFGSTWRAALPDQTNSVAVRKLVAAVVNEINQAMSPYLAQSESPSSTAWIRLTGKAVRHRLPLSRTMRSR
jgi:hypothetical protein